ncbi:hypothetical protein J6590_059315 [Homalodisca vitripennis]|nr:hypothetical protein J6590_059315 [Homalodisca vitripennis]
MVNDNAQRIINRWNGRSSADIHQEESWQYIITAYRGKFLARENWTVDGLLMTSQGVKTTMRKVPCQRELDSRRLADDIIGSENNGGDIILYSVSTWCGKCY